MNGKSKISIQFLFMNCDNFQHNNEFLFVYFDNMTPIQRTHYKDAYLSNLKYHFFELPHMVPHWIKGLSVLSSVMLARHDPM